MCLWSCRGVSLRRPWKNSTHLPREVARAIRTCIQDIISTSLFLAADETLRSCVGLRLLEEFSVSTSSQLAQFSPGNLDIFSTSSSCGGCDGFFAAFGGIFRTPPHGVESRLSADFSALDGQQLSVVESSGVAGTPGV